MGAWICKRATPMRVLFIGLDAAGKTTVLYRMKLGEVVTTIPTIGFNVETVSVKGLEITCWDVGGRDKIRPLIRHYLQNTTACVYVLDSTDRDRVDQAMDELFSNYLSQDEMARSVCMVLANKQDLDGAMTVAQVEDHIRRAFKEKEHLDQSVFVYPVSAMEGTGLYEAFEVFVEQIKLKKEDQLKGGLISVDTTAHAAKKTEGKADNAGESSLVKRLVKDPALYLKSLLFY